MDNEKEENKVSLSSADTIGTRALKCSNDRKMYIVLGKTTQAYLEKATQCKLVGKYCSKDLHPRIGWRILECTRIPLSLCVIN